MPELPVKLELSRMSRPDVYLLLAPFLPGGALLGAVVLRNWTLAAKFIYSHFLGYYSKMTILALAAYFLGLLMMFVSEAISREVSRQLGKWIPHPTQNQNYRPWNALEWRRLARLFIGSKLTPETDLPLDNARYEQLAATIEQISDPEQKRAQAAQLVQARETLAGADLQWMNWYFILRNYISNEEALKNDLFRHSIIFLFNSCGMAGLIALILVPEARNWFLWVLFGTAELIGLVFPFAVDRLSSTCRYMTMSCPPKCSISSAKNGTARTRHLNLRLNRHLCGESPLFSCFRPGWDSGPTGWSRPSGLR